MDNRALYHTIAKAVRVEYDSETDTIYLVFEITDEKFKQDIRQNWTQDIDLKVIGKELIKFKE